MPVVSFVYIDASRQNFLFLNVQQRQTLTEMPSYLNVFDVKKMYFCQTSDVSIYMRF